MEDEVARLERRIEQLEQTLDSYVIALTDVEVRLMAYSPGSQEAKRFRRLLLYRVQEGLVA